MTILKDTFLSILSLDAYNRGYNEGIKGLGGDQTQIGNVTIVRQSDNSANSAARANNFYGIAYRNYGDMIPIA